MVSKGQEGSLVFLVQMDTVIREEKARRVNLDSLAILVCKEKMVTQAVEERRGPRESEGRGAILDFLGLLELQVTKAHQEKWASRAQKAWQIGSLVKLLISCEETPLAQKVFPDAQHSQRKWSLPWTCPTTSPSQTLRG